jgi:hypothetical protein
MEDSLKDNMIKYMRQDLDRLPRENLERLVQIFDDVMENRINNISFVEAYTEALIPYYNLFEIRQKFSDMKGKALDDTINGIWRG